MIIDFSIKTLEETTKILRHTHRLCLYRNTKCLIILSFDIQHFMVDLKTTFITIVLAFKRHKAEYSSYKDPYCWT